MNKFAKYVPEADKKKQREHIGAVGIAELPFGEEVVDVSLQWDGDITNKPYRIYGFNYGVCLVYPNVTPSKEELVGHTFTYFKEGNEPITVTATLDALQDHYDNNDMGDICIGYRLFNRETDDIVLDVRTLPQDDIPTPGICLYFDTTTTTPGPDDEITGHFISSDYSFKHTVIKSIDPKYLPNPTVFVTVDTDFDTMEMTASHSYDEVKELVMKGINVTLVIDMSAEGMVAKQFASVQAAMFTGDATTEYILFSPTVSILNETTAQLGTITYKPDLEEGRGIFTSQSFRPAPMEL